jgi:hypothetical protein
VGGDLTICEWLTECDAARQGCSPLEEPGRFDGDPESVVPKPGCEARFDLDSNGVLDCGTPKAFCDVDGPDRDGVFNQLDRCPTQSDPGQSDADQDQLGDVCDPDDQTTLPCNLDCNVDQFGEGEFPLIDHRDIAKIFASVGTRVQGFAACGDRRDRDQDRLITVLDARACVEQCTFTDCASEGD